MLHTKSQGHPLAGSVEEDLLKGFYHILMWRPSWSCDQDHLNKLRFPVLRSFHIKFEFNWPSSFRGEDVLKMFKDGLKLDGQTLE